MRCSIVPPYLLQQIADAPGLGRALDPDLVERIRETLQVDAALRDVRSRGGLRMPATATGGWVVHTARNTAELPGTPVRDQDQPESGDEAVDEAWVGIRASLELFRDVYDRASYDDENARVSATVHYQRDYANAFWDGSQLVFGDGDGEIFGRFTRAIDVLGHELSHGVVEFSAGLVYEGQSGALNESVADVFASCMKQRHLGQSAAEGDWLIGAGLLLPRVEGRALRSMAAPGTAYDDPVLGKDPQPDHMDDFVETTDDNGGVHINSGIPNKAFHLAATAIGGSAAQGAGRIWYDALLQVSSDADFATFARATVDAAGDRADTIRSAWEQVGLRLGAPSSGGGGAGGGGRDDEGGESGESGGGSGGDGEGRPVPAERVEVRRSGGFAGRTTAAELALDDDSDERAAEARELVERINFGLGGGQSYPDGYVYAFRVGDRAVSLPEQDLDDDLRRLAQVVLGDEV